MLPAPCLVDRLDSLTHLIDPSNERLIGWLIEWLIDIMIQEENWEEVVSRGYDDRAKMKVGKVIKGIRIPVM